MAKGTHPSRREFLAATAAGLVTASCAKPRLAGVRTATAADTPGLIGDGRRRRMLLHGGVVLSLDPRVDDFDSCCHKGQNTTAPQYVLRP